MATDTDNSISTKKLWQQLLLVGLLLAAGITLGSNINKIYVNEKNIAKNEARIEKMDEVYKTMLADMNIIKQDVAVIKAALIPVEKNK